MSERTQRKVWVSQQLKDMITSYWRSQTQYRGETTFTREVVEDLAKLGEIDEAQLAGYDMPSRQNSIRIWCDDAAWHRLGAEADRLGISLHAVVRRRIIRVIEEAHARS